MTRRRLIFLLIILIILIGAWQLPTVLKAIPSRYVAAYLPQSVQAMAERKHSEILPTVVVDANAMSLLESSKPDQEIEMTRNPDQNNQKIRVTPTFPVFSIPTKTTWENSQPESEVESTLIPKSLPQASPTPVPIPITSRLESFNHQFQTWNNCGPATLAMGLSYFDVLVSQEATASFLKPNPEDRNVSPEELVAYVDQETKLKALSRTNGDLHLLRLLIAAGFPVIVELGINPPGEYRWMGWYGHYLLAVAYDDTNKEFWMYDSWFGTSEIPGENADDQGRQVRYQDLDSGWREFNRNYIVLYQPDQEAMLTEIIGQNMDDNVMWSEALRKVEEELQESPENAFLWFNLGTVHNALGNYEKAALAFDQARAIGLPWRMLWYQFGPYESYYQIGRFEDVILLADVTLKDRPYFEESYYYRGLAHAALGDMKKAQADLEKAVNFNSHFTLAGQALEELKTEAGLDGDS